MRASVRGSFCLRADRSEPDTASVAVRLGQCWYETRQRRHPSVRRNFLLPAQRRAGQEQISLHAAAVSWYADPRNACFIPAFLLRDQQVLKQVGAFF